MIVAKFLMLPATRVLAKSGVSSCHLRLLMYSSAAFWKMSVSWNTFPPPLWMHYRRSLLHHAFPAEQRDDEIVYFPLAGHVFAYFSLKAVHRLSKPCNGYGCPFAFSSAALAS